MSTKVDNLGAIGWKPQQPYVISGADYKLGPDYEGHIGVPVELDTALGTSGVDTDDQNKRWVKPYASATSATVALGVMFKELGAKGNAYERRLGRGGYRRDLALLQFGIIPILNVGSTTVTMYDRVAPLYNATDALSGFGAWSEGQKILGYCFQAEIPAGHFGWIFVTVEATPASNSGLDDLSNVAITGPLTSGDVLQYNGANFVDVPLTLGIATDYTETSIATGQTIMWDGSNFVNATLISELLDTPVTTGDNHEFTATGTPLAIVDVFSSGADQVPDVKYLYDATATVPTLSYNWSGTTISTNKATDADTHILVTYWYDENA